MSEIDISPKKLLADIDRLTAERDAARQETAGAQKERDDYLAALQRERAEFLNFKRRTADERQAMLGLAAESLILKFLGLADDFDRAIEARPPSIAGDPWVGGVVAIDRKLRQLLDSEGVAPIDASPGVAFDPREHEAIANVPATGIPAGHVVEQLRRGYRLRERVIRPAMVAVAEGGGDPTATDGAATGRVSEPETDTTTNRPIN
ncbi:MAG TPA: nucleotide exchange factor GrpE [Candidatus Eisenbacteria bacterium]|nr:nucleotide exchange factor GrpE [Candidatus Eisenbacteria bacterium]